MSKRSLNLSLDEAAVERGKRYSESHHTSISRLVNDFLSRLPLGKGEPFENDLTPAVHRLTGIGAGEADKEDYRKHLLEKYGQ